MEKKSNDQVADDDLLLKTLENAVSAKQGYMHILIAVLGEQTESELLDLSDDSHIAKQCCDV